MDISNVFEKIIVDGREIDLQSLTLLDGLVNVGSQKDVIVEYLFKNNSQIPAKTFKGLKQLKYAYFPSNIKTIGEQAFANSGLSYIDNLSYVNYIGSQAFSYSKLSYVNGANVPGSIASDAWSYIDTLNSDFKDKLSYKYPYIDFGDGFSYNSSYSYNDSSSNNDDSQTSYNGDNSYNGNSGEENSGNDSGNTSYNDNGNIPGYDPNWMNYNVGAQYRMPLIYTTRSGNQYEQRIGDITFEILEIDDNEERSSQYRLKINVKALNITNPLQDRTIPYMDELVGRNFWIPDSCLTADIDMFSTIPGFVIGESGVDSFLGMKGEGDTYHPELENYMGVTDYAIRKMDNDMNQYLLATIQV